mgnify:CR=1 FL=1|jgi:hypothetical protein
MSSVPEDATARICGLYYKIGQHGLSFRWNGGEWIKSSMKADNITKGKLS